MNLDFSKCKTKEDVEKVYAKRRKSIEALNFIKKRVQAKGSEGK